MPLVEVARPPVDLTGPGEDKPPVGDRRPLPTGQEDGLGVETQPAPNQHVIVVVGDSRLVYERDQPIGACVPRRPCPSRPQPLSELNQAVDGMMTFLGGQGAGTEVSVVAYQHDPGNGQAESVLTGQSMADQGAVEQTRITIRGLLEQARGDALLLSALQELEPLILSGNSPRTNVVLLLTGQLPYDAGNPPDYNRSIAAVHTEVARLREEYASSHGLTVSVIFGANEWDTYVWGSPPDELAIRLWRDWVEDLAAIGGGFFLQADQVTPEELDGQFLSITPPVVLGRLDGRVVYLPPRLQVNPPPRRSGKGFFPWPASRRAKAIV